MLQLLLRPQLYTRLKIESNNPPDVLASCNTMCGMVLLYDCAAAGDMCCVLCCVCHSLFIVQPFVLRQTHPTFK